VREGSLLSPVGTQTGVLDVPGMEEIPGVYQRGGGLCVRIEAEPVGRVSLTDLI